MSKRQKVLGIIALSSYLFGFTALFCDHYISKLKAQAQVTPDTSDLTGYVETLSASDDLNIKFDSKYTDQITKISTATKQGSPLNFTCQSVSGGGWKFVKPDLANNNLGYFLSPANENITFNNINPNATTDADNDGYGFSKLKQIIFKTDGSKFYIKWFNSKQNQVGGRFKPDANNTTTDANGIHEVTLSPSSNDIQFFKIFATNCKFYSFTFNYDC